MAAQPPLLKNPSRSKHIAKTAGWVMFLSSENQKFGQKMPLAIVFIVCIAIKTIAC
jgi:hypothetical protein